MIRSSKIALSGLICLVLIVLAGCQGVSGIDLQKAAVQSLKVASYEGSATVSIQLSGDAFAEAAAAQPLMKLLNNLTIQLDAIKKQDKDHLSASGKLIAGQASIPIDLYMDKQLLAVKVEGAAHPVVFNTGTILTAALGSVVPAVNQLPVDLGNLGSVQNQLIEAAVPFLAKNLPNPGKITVDPASETINGETLSLNKVHVEIAGDEFQELFKKAIENILADEQGMKDLLGQLYSAVAGSPAGGGAGGLVVNYLYGMVKDSLAEAAQKGKTFFGDNSSLKADLYADDQLTVRKSALDASMTFPYKGKSMGVKVAVKSEKWNIGKPVAADAIDISNAVEYGKGAAMAHFVKSLDGGSQAYKSLVGDLNVLKKNIRLALSKDGKFAAGSPFIKAPGTTMVPARYVAEHLDADVEWNGDARQVTITGVLSGRTILLTIGSKWAKVDGQQMALDDDVAAEIDADLTYVPVRFIAEHLGATVGWDNETRTVKIDKE